MPLPADLALRLRRYGWLAGLPLLALAWGGATLLAAPGIAARIEAEGMGVARTTQDSGGEPWLRVAAQGRDLVARGEAPGEAERDAVLGRLAALPGLRRVVSEVGLIEAVSPFAWAAERTDRAVVITGSRPAEIGRHALEVQIAAALPELSLDDAARAARGAPPDFAAAAAFAAARLGKLGRGGRVSVTDTVISASGEAVDVAAYDALRSAFAEPPRGFSMGRVEILPPSVADFQFAVERVSGGGIVLTGYTVSEAARSEIRKQAEELAEGAFVDDRTRTARGLPRGVEPKALVSAMLKLVGLVQRGRVGFAEGRVSVSGDALDGQAVGEVEALLRAELPAGVAAGTVDLTVKPLSPYQVAIRREAELVSVSGHLADAEMRARVMAAVRPRFFRERIVDRTRLGAGAPADLAAALEAAVPVLATLASGEIAVADRALSLSGTSLYRESAARAGDALRRGLPPGWSAKVAVEPRDPPPRKSPESCRDGFEAASSRVSLRFEAGSLALTSAMYPTLDAAAALARACPGLRITVAGHADPPGAKPVKPAEPAEAKPEPPKDEKPATSKAAKSAPKPAPKKPAKPEPAPEPAPEEVARARAQVIAEYLLQAGAGMDQVSIAEEPPGERRTILLALKP
ncbi:hypothetical protein [Methylobacterium dankookense]|uniref:BON domain-containing protein n=1 Tax=Methylobacterium dankookense TaxID=560405 RepID=A0A564FSB8_9HYPH|nr:hypothetical protein [Methylobacterium dankookense]GJD56092.1 hypothetical protein IFDJLNFL_1986 [Methylobacterium dankookense]VUF10654.1 hypothetical protein MTDSW087_00324 [Methylobacterium dankookense]